MDEVVGDRYGYHERGSQYCQVFLEKQLVQVLHAGSVCLADSDFTIALADVEERDAEQAEARYDNGSESKDIINAGNLLVVLVKGFYIVFQERISKFFYTIYRKGEKCWETCGFNDELYDLTEEAEIAGIMHVLNKDLI